MKVERQVNMIRVLLLLTFALLASGSVFTCYAQQVVDKMVATVNAGVRTDLITYSDLLGTAQSCTSFVDRPAAHPSGSGENTDDSANTERGE